MNNLTVGLFVGLALCSCEEAKKKTTQPNFIVILSDDQRQDAAGFDGNPVIQTPMLDKFASRGVRFTNANTVFSLCSPSRAALLTGRYGSCNGVLELGSDLNSSEKTVARYLHDQGYLTGLSGKWHVGRNPSEAGFDYSVWFEGNGTYYNREIHDQGKLVHPDIHCDQYCVSRSVEFLQKALKERKPFFLFHNTQLPHMDGKMIWNARKETKTKYLVTDMPLAGNLKDDLKDKPEYLKTVRNRLQAKEYGYPDPLAVQNHTLDYYSVITEMDSFLGPLFHAVEEMGLLENTWVIFMSDNGWMLGDHGMTSKVLPYRPSTHVPAFILGPGVKPSKNDELILNIDLLPTILELAGIKADSGIHGKSLLPLLQGNAHGWRKEFIYEGLGSYGGAKPNLTVVSNDYRYIETYQDNLLNEIIFRELYDQKNDPDEMHNLVSDHNMQMLIADCQKKIAIHKKTILSAR